MVVRRTNLKLLCITELTNDLKVDAVQFRKKESGVMDSRIGLDYIVENSEYVSKLAAALDTHNETVKKQVFELLSALCAYSKDGYKRAVDTLENYKVSFFYVILKVFYNISNFKYLPNILDKVVLSFFVH